MAITPDSIEYTAKDFSALRRRLFQLISSVFPAWTDDDVADFGNILVELFARTGDVLTFYQDRQANESRITTALLRKTMIAFAKLVGFKPSGAIAALVIQQFTLISPTGVPTPAAADVLLVKGTIVHTATNPGAVAFQLVEDLIIQAGQTTASAIVENSTFQTEAFVSTNQKNQTYRLAQTPYLDGSATAVAGNGAYVEVPNFVGTAGTDRNFTITVDENDSAVQRFGDGNVGSIPSGTVVIDYRTWGGLVGRLGANTLTKIDGAYADGNGNPVRLAVTNLESTTIGFDRQSVERLRELIPLATRVPRAAVAREDYEIGAVLVPTIARALHLTSNEDPAVGENEGFLYLTMLDGLPPSQTILDQARAQFFKVPGFPKPPFPSMSTYKLTVLGTIFKNVDVHAKIFKSKGVLGPKAKANILAALATFFAIQNEDGSSNTRVNYGYYLQNTDGDPTNSLAYSDVYNAVRDATGVLKLGAGAGDFLLNGLRADVPLLPKDFPRLGAVVLLDGDTGLVL